MCVLYERQIIGVVLKWGLLLYQEVASVVMCTQHVLKGKFFYSAVSNPQECSKA